MAKALSVIEDLVQWEARDDSLSLSSTQGLVFVNAIYRSLAAFYHWPELYKDSSSLSTVAGQAAYTWSFSKVFLDVKAVEIQDPGDDLKYKLVMPAKSVLEFNQYQQQKDSFPVVYRRDAGASTNYIRFAPAPNTGSLTIRITGTVEPTELTAAGSTTVWYNHAMDDAFAYLIAADVLYKREFPEQAQRLVQRASDIMGTIIGKEITPQEVNTRILANA